MHFLIFRFFKVFEVCPCCCEDQYFILSRCWMIFHCMWFVYPIHLLLNSLVFSRLLWTKPLSKIFVQLLASMYVSFLLGKYRNVCLGPMRKVHLTLLSNCFREWMSYFACLSAVLPHPCQHLPLFVFLTSRVQVLKSDIFKILIRLLADPITLNKSCNHIEASFQSHFKNENNNTFFIRWSWESKCSQEKHFALTTWFMQTLGAR